MNQIDRLTHYLAGRFDQLSLRERVIILVALLTALGVGWNQVLLDPLRASTSSQARQLGQIRKANADLEVQTALLEEKNNEDLDRENRQRLAALKTELAQMAQGLQKVLGDLVPANEMPALLDELLALRSSLQLVKMENLGSEPWPPPGPENRPRSMADGGLYRHSVRLELEGSYLDALAFFRDAEQLPRRLSWDSLEIRLVEYPRARIVLTVATLSQSSRWIRV